jgi:NADPH2:quinone reductase
MADLPTTMRAAVVEKLEGPGALSIVERPVPSPGPGEVLIKVEAAGLNYADVAQSAGAYPGGPAAPYISGVEACGEVVAVGEGAGYRVGDKVIGAGGSAFAEYVAWPSAALFPRPPHWSAGQGASFFVQWLTAHGCLRTIGQLKEGETVLVHAAAGGVGQAAVRIAKHFGAKVIATASTAEKLAIAEKLGADVCVNYTSEDFVKACRDATGGQGVDLILEMVGGETFEKNLRAVRSFGRIVVFGAASNEQRTVDNVSLIFKPVVLAGYHLSILAAKRPDLFMAELAEVQELIAKGVIAPEEPTSRPLNELAAAMIDLQARKTTGKVVLIP